MCIGLSKKGLSFGGDFNPDSAVRILQLPNPAQDVQQESGLEF